MEWNRIKLQILATDEPGAGFQHFIEKESVSTYQVQMEAMQFLEEGGAYSEDALDKRIRMDADYIKAWYQRGWVCRSTCHLTVFLVMLCNKIQTRTGQSLNLFQL